jgi:hypothetical protein
MNALEEPKLIRMLNTKEVNYSRMVQRCKGLTWKAGLYFISSRGE